MENLNSVCYINKINSISPIEGADNIEKATVNGWESIVMKGIHKMGDEVLCITTDAVIPQELADKWGVSQYLRKGNRVRTVRLRKTISECILIPYNKVGPTGFKKYNGEGTCLMKELNIFKYEPPVRIVMEHGGRKHKYKDNSNFHVYYKFPNQKNVPDMFKEGDEVVITRKLHGTNARYGIVRKQKLSFLDKIKKFFRLKFNEYEFVYGSHNVQKGSDSNGFYSTDVWKEVGDRYGVKEKLWEMVSLLGRENVGDGFIIYGEIYGPGIQGEKYSYNEKEHKLALFDIEMNGKYMNDFDFFQHSCILDLPQVPLLYKGPWSKDVQDNLVLNQFIEGTKTPHEGVVVKCVTGDRHRVSKVINPDYLMFSEEHNVPDSH